MEPCLITEPTGYFNPRTLQESATGVGFGCGCGAGVFQSTHPTRECDSDVNIMINRPFRFQSTHPTRECDDIQPVDDDKMLISIHAPYKRVRQRAFKRFAKPVYFNPRTLQESATRQCGLNCRAKIFQSTHPTRECDFS